MAETTVKNLMDEVKSIADDSYLLGIEVAMLYVNTLKEKNKVKTKQILFDEILDGLQHIRKTAMEQGCSNF